MKMIFTALSRSAALVLAAFLLVLVLPLSALAQDELSTDDTEIARVLDSPADASSVIPLVNPTDDIKISGGVDSVLYFDENNGDQRWWLDEATFDSASERGYYNSDSKIIMSNAVYSGELTIKGSATLSAINLLDGSYYNGMNLRITDASQITVLHEVTVESLRVDGASSLNITDGADSDTSYLIYLPGSLVLDNGTINMTPAADSGFTSFLEANSMILTNNSSLVLDYSDSAQIYAGVNIIHNGVSGGDAIIDNSSTLNINLASTGLGFSTGGDLQIDDAALSISSPGGQGMVTRGDVVIGKTATLTISANTGVEVDGSMRFGSAQEASNATLTITSMSEALVVNKLLEVYGTDTNTVSIDARANQGDPSSAFRNHAVLARELILDNTKIVAISEYASGGQQIGLIIEGDSGIEPQSSVSTLSNEVTVSTTDAIIEASGAINGMKLTGNEFNFTRSTITAKVLPSAVPLVAPLSAAVPTDSSPSAIYSVHGVFTFDTSTLSASGGDFGWRSDYDESLAVPPLETDFSSGMNSINRLRFTNGTTAQCEGNLSGVFVSTEITVSDNSDLTGTSLKAQPQDDGTAYEYMPAIFLTTYDKAAGRVISCSREGLVHEVYNVPVKDVISTTATAPSKPYHEAWNMGDYQNYDWRVPGYPQIIIEPAADGIYTTSGTGQHETGLSLEAQRITNDIDERVVLDDNAAAPSTHMISLLADFESQATKTYTVDFETHGGSPQPAQQIVTAGEKATEPTEVIYEGYTLLGWYTEEGYVTEWDFDAAVTEDMTLHAKWEKDNIFQPTDPDDPKDPDDPDDPKDPDDPDDPDKPSNPSDPSDPDEPKKLLAKTSDPLDVRVISVLVIVGALAFALLLYRRRIEQ